MVWNKLTQICDKVILVHPKIQLQWNYFFNFLHQGAYILDSILNFNETEGSQLLPETYLTQLPGTNIIKLFFAQTYGSVNLYKILNALNEHRRNGKASKLLLSFSTITTPTLNDCYGVANVYRPTRSQQETPWCRWQKEFTLLVPPSTRIF